ncbi:MAG TPA: carbohydrate kinase family protein [Burkholderiales bacterium]|nr:carbohydrate kinase family protein [Burkholderiales bacterium]
MSALICGSLAFDTIMLFQDHFKHHILPEKIHMLNVSFLVPELRREFGGCAGNIAYNLKLLDGEPVIMAACGEDFAPYAAHLDRHGIDRRHILPVPGSFTAQAFITTDLSDNQITAFHPGAMNHSHLNHAGQAAGIKLGIISPDGREGMLQHAREMHAAGISFIFDPGQGLPMFDGKELMQFIELADYVAVNDYEAELLLNRTGRTIQELVRQVRAFIVTRGEAGSQIHTEDGIIDIPCARASTVLDPTGCGDAYRAGLLYGIINGYDWPTTGRLASLMGAIKIACRGGQNHAPSKAEIEQLFRAEFGYDLA